MAAALGERALVVWTKADLPGERPGSLAADAVVSARTGEGLDALRALVRRRLGGAEGEGEILVLDRHRDALRRAASAAAAVAEAPDDELAASSIREALHSLGEITGETASEELLDRIFSTFCIGK